MSTLGKGRWKRLEGTIGTGGSRTKVKKGGDVGDLWDWPLILA